MLSEIIFSCSDRVAVWWSFFSGSDWGYVSAEFILWRSDWVAVRWNLICRVSGSPQLEFLNFDWVAFRWKFLSLFGLTSNGIFMFRSSCVATEITLSCSDRVAVLWIFRFGSCVIRYLDRHLIFFLISLKLHWRTAISMKNQAVCETSGHLSMSLTRSSLFSISLKISDWFRITISLTLWRLFAIRLSDFIVNTDRKEGDDSPISVALHK